MARAGVGAAMLALLEGVSAMRLVFDLWVSWWIGLAWLVSGWLIAGTLSLAGVQLLTWIAYALALIASVGWPVVVVVVLSRRRGWGLSWWF